MWIWKPEDFCGLWQFGSIKPEVFWGKTDMINCRKLQRVQNFNKKIPPWVFSWKYCRQLLHYSGQQCFKTPQNNWFLVWYFIFFLSVVLDVLIFIQKSAVFTYNRELRKVFRIEFILNNAGDLTYAITVKELVTANCDKAVKWWINLFSLKSVTQDVAVWLSKLEFMKIVYFVIS